MNLFDPQREVLNDVPCYANGFAINAWQVTCAPNGGLFASIMLHVGNWQFKYYSVELSHGELAPLLFSFREDPEKTLEGLFNEDEVPPQLRAPPLRADAHAPNLNDLDLI